MESLLSSRHDLSLLVLKKHRKTLQSALFSCVQGNRISFVRILVEYGRLNNSSENLGRNVFKNIVVRKVLQGTEDNPSYLLSWKFSLI